MLIAFGTCRDYVKREYRARKGKSVSQHSEGPEADELNAHYIGAVPDPANCGRSTSVRSYQCVNKAFRIHDGFMHR